MQAHVVIKGEVQKVGFRHFVRYNAKALGLVGWVKNTPTGQVDALFQGSQETIDAMLTLCKKGPLLAQVKDIVVSWSEKQDHFADFTLVV